MKANEDYAKSSESSKAGATWPEGGKLYSETFANPHEYLATLRSNFSDLSHNANNLSLQDLVVDADDQSLSPRARAAAKITASHFNQFHEIAQQSKRTMSGNITRDDINFVMDMAEHNYAHYAQLEKSKDVGIAVGLTAIWTLPWTGFALGAIAEGGAFLAFPVAGAAIGVGLATGFALKASKDHSRFEKNSTDDEKKVREWLK